MPNGNAGTTHANPKGWKAGQRRMEVLHRVSVTIGGRTVNVEAYRTVKGDNAVRFIGPEGAEATYYPQRGTVWCAGVAYEAPKGQDLWNVTPKRGLVTAASKRSQGDLNDLIAGMVAL